MIKQSATCAALAPPPEVRPDGGGDEEHGEEHQVVDDAELGPQLLPRQQRQLRLHHYYY